MKSTYRKLSSYISKLSTINTVILLTVVSLVARSIFLTKSSIWHDEGYSTMIINQPISEIIAKTINDVHPPLYYILLHIWQAIFGASVISLRGFSVICGVLTVVLLYLLLKRLFNENIAKLGGLFAAIGPFLVRYSDEARMYSLAALLAVASTYALVLALDKKTKRRYLWWASYGLAVAAGLYTQYFFVFLVPVHLAYAAHAHSWKLNKLVKDRGWWLGNLIGGGLFLFWLPVMLDQTSRVSEGFWIPPMSSSAIANTFSYFVSYDDSLVSILGITLPIIALIVSLVYLKKQRANTWLVAGWLLMPIILVALLSLKNPVYIDRYFTYSAPAFYALLAIAILSLKTKNPWLKPTLIIATCWLFIGGILQVGKVAGHQMENATEVINQNYQEGDEVISAELYTFFDSSYYNQTDTEIKLLSEKPFGKYGEYSLVHDRPDLRIAKLDDVKAKRVWLIGKTGEQEYFTKDIPKNWQETKTSFEGGDSVVRLYEIANQ